MSERLVSVGDEDRLGGRLQLARLAAFVGRKEELAAFDEALCGGGVLFVHGPGGIGKSALLASFAQRAGECGHTVLRLDGRLLDPSPAAFLAATTSLFAGDRPVLLVDDFECLRGLETWLRERFLPSLPAGSLVVLSGRTSPDPAWLADPGWTDLLQVIELGDLEPMDAGALLDSRGVTGELLAFAGGHPLALSLGAAAGGRPTPDLVTALLDRIVGDVPGPAHRQALEVCAHTYRTTQDLLRALLPGEDAAALFSWLRRLPFVGSSPLGVYPHDIVREIVDADLRWRDPRGHADLRQRIRTHLTQQIHSAADADVLRTVGSLFYLHRTQRWRGDDEITEDVFRPEDTDDLRRLVAEQDVADWLIRQPQAFRLYRTANGELVGASAWLRKESDPAVPSDTAPLRPGEHGAVYRTWVREPRWGTSPVVNLVQWRAVGWVLRSERLAWSFMADRADPTRGQFHDWRVVPPRAWLDRLLSGSTQAVTHEPALAVLSQEEFTDAVRTALRHLSKHGELAANPLTRTRLLAGRVDPGPALRALLEDAIRDLGRDPRAGKPHRALDATYLRGAHTQEAAAERLGLSFSTYRRHLVAGIERISETLWHREVRG